MLPNPDGEGSVLVGVQAASLWKSTTVESLLSWVQDPGPNGTVQVLAPDGFAAAMDQQIATGMVVEATSEDDEVLQSTTVVVTGDVTGTGDMSLTQLARIASAFTGADPLSGPYALAADRNGDNELSLTDLVGFARDYTESQPEVSCDISSGDVAAVLADAGYDLEPWCESVAVLKAEIPEDAEISSIEWTQCNTLPDGSVSMMACEGMQDTLVFGALESGSTVVTTTVTTAQGKTGTQETRVDWPGNSMSRAVTKPVVKPIHPSATTRPVASPNPSASATAKPTPSPETTAEKMLPTYRAEVLGAVNDLRKEQRIKPELQRSEDLAKAALVRAKEMANAGKLSHTRPNGSKYDTVVTLGKGAVVGENIHCNNGYLVPEIAYVAIDGWENSAPHRKQLLEPRYKYTGIGFEQAKDGTWYCVEMFSNEDDVLSVDKPR